MTYDAHRKITTMPKGNILKNYAIHHEKWGNKSKKEIKLYNIFSKLLPKASASK